MAGIVKNVKNTEDDIYWAVQSGLLEIDDQGRIWRVTPVRRRAEKAASGGYLQVRVMADGVRHHASAHRLVYRHLHGPIAPGMTVNHENGVKTDNRPSNLTLATHSQQMQHARSVLGRCRRDSERMSQAKLSHAAVAEIRRRRAAGERLKSIASDFHVSPQTVSRIALGKRWRGTPPTNNSVAQATR